MKWLPLPILFISSVTFSFSQIFSSTQFLGQNNGGLPVGVPFLLVSPDPRAASMGETGAATSCDEFSSFHNASKLAFYHDGSSAGVCYTPWLRALLTDLNYVYLSYVNKISKQAAVSSSLSYFSYGPLTNSGTQFRPNEFAIDVAYARKLSRNFSMAMAGRYIYSNLFNADPGYALTFDLSAFKSDTSIIKDHKTILSFGTNLSNIGGKISYFTNISATKLFLPTNLKIGSCIKTFMDEYNSISVSVDLNKLLVPTPTGINPTSFPGSMLNSMHDAPGGFKEEIKEIMIGSGIEYSYANIFKVRGGYFFESEMKGGRKYFTAGFGIVYNIFHLDFAYLIPTNNRNPLQNTLRFSLSFIFGKFNRQKISKGSEDDYVK